MNPGRRLSRPLSASLALPTLLAACMVVFAPSPGVWLDEAATASATTRSWSQLWLLTSHQDRALLGYYAITKAAADLSGQDVLAAGRAISSLSYVFGVATVSWLAARLGGAKSALFAGAAMALLPASAAAAVNARPEGLSIFLISAYLCFAARQRPISQIFVGLLACVTYALNCLYLPLAVLIPILSGRRVTRSDLATAAIPSVFGGVWVLVCSSQQRQVSWVHTSLGSDVVASFIRVGVSAPTSRTAEAWVTGSSVAIGIAFVALGVGLLCAARTRVSAAVCIALWTFPPLVACVAVAVGKDIFVERYFSPSVIGLALLVGFAGSRFEATKHRLLSPATGAVLVLLCAPSIVSSHQPDGHWGENIGLHLQSVRAAGPEHVFFVAPRNRAVLFASGRLESQWGTATWWAQAKAEGTLWGRQGRPTNNVDVVVTDTRSLAKRKPSASCQGTERYALLAQEARFTSLRVTCAR